MKKYLSGFIAIFLFCSCRNGVLQQKTSQQLVNLSHLNHLYEEIEIDGMEMAIIHIYSEYPDYGWVDANGEGISALDDVARAAVVYLRHFETTGESESLNRARKLLEFCRHMQADDGQFYNFLYQDHSINREGQTSFKSFGWWAARGLWAMGEGYRVFLGQDVKYANHLAEDIKKSFPQIDALLANYPRVEWENGFAAPRWLLNNSAADATSELMLGLAAYGEASHDPGALDYLQKFGEGLLKMQLRAEQFHGVHLSWKNIWHGWANGQTQALARAGKLLNNQKFIDSAALECTLFYRYWIDAGFPRELTLEFGARLKVTETKQFDQIAYAVRPAVLGALTLYQVTGDEQFADRAAELAAWLFGSNPAHSQMYDPETGRCFDGIMSESEINRNAGAESTIEALYTVLELVANPVARGKLQGYLN